MVCNQATERCLAGACKLVICNNMGDANCNGGCCHRRAALARDPLNCGGCGNTCDTDQLCVQGMCQDYFASPSCTTCPCAACGAGTQCCSLQHRGAADLRGRRAACPG